MAQKFCIYQRDISNQYEGEYACMKTENSNYISLHVCPFKTNVHAEYICHYYTRKNTTDSIEERLDRLEQAMKCLQVILKE